METLTFEFPAGAPARGRALAGCVGSGDLEISEVGGNVHVRRPPEAR